MNIENLFRKEAIEHKQTSIEGNVILLPPAKFRYLTMLLGALVVSFFLFMILNTYTLKEQVRGVVHPKLGVIQVKAPRSGTLNEVFVTFDQLISKDQPLLSILNEKNISSDQNLMIAEIMNIENQIANIGKIISEKKANRTTEVDYITDQIRDLMQLKSNVEARFDIITQQIKREENQLDSLLSLKAQNLHSEYNIIEKENTNSSRQIELLRMKELIKSFEIDIKEANYKLDSRQFEEELLNLENRILALKANQELLQYEKRLFLKAPESGTIASVNFKQGEYVDEGVVLLKILPQGSDLEIVLYIPTSASGFVEPGQSVNIKYDAFPYQKFGMYSGTIVEVEKALLFPSELAIPNLVSEPSYKATVRLDETKINAYAKSFSLRAGMTLEADIIMYERTFLEWLFSPIFSLRGGV